MISWAVKTNDLGKKKNYFSKVLFINISRPSYGNEIVLIASANNYHPKRQPPSPQVFVLHINVFRPKRCNRMKTKTKQLYMLSLAY